MNSKRRLLFLTVLILLTIACFPFAYSNEAICTNPKHDYIDSDFSHILWSVSDLYPFSNGIPLLTATSDNVIIAARTENSSSLRNNLHSYNAYSGNLSWQKTVRFPLLLESDKTTVYVGNYDKIDLFDSTSGALLKSISLPGVGNIVSFYHLNDVFYVHGSGGRFVTYNTIEKTQTTSEQNFVTRPFLIEDNILYTFDVNKFKAIDKNTERVLWQTEVPGIASPVFSDKVILSRTGNPIYAGNIYAIDKESGNIIWNNNANVIGNIEVKESKVYYLSVDGYLVVLDQLSGQEITRIGFSNTPFTLSSPDSSISIGGYYVAANPDGKTIYTAFGDSCQLYAIEIID